MSRWLSFEDRNVLVVGGTSGINLGIAEAFAEQGANVAVVSRSQDKVEAAMARLSAYGRTVAGFSADVRDVAALEAGFASLADPFREIHTLVVGQAGNFPAPAMQLSPGGFKSVVDIDLLGSFNVVRAAHELLAEADASIITISAPQGAVPMKLQAHVCAAKAGVDMLTRVLALELGPENIRVNAIVPGPIDETEGMARLAPTGEARRKCRDSVPMKRFGTARDVANCAMFLASPLAGYINGAIIPVDGGWLAAGVGLDLETLAGGR